MEWGMSYSHSQALQGIVCAYIRSSVPRRPVRPVGTARIAVPGVPGVCLKL